MPYLGQKPKDTFTASASQTITGTGATSYSLNQTVTSPEDIEVFINNVQQQPTVAYTVSGQTITFDEALLSTDSCYVVFRGARTESRTHPAGSSIQAANATFTGDLTVDTNTLIVDASSNSVGIGATPDSNRDLHIKRTGANASILIEETSATNYGQFIELKDSSTSWFVANRYANTNSGQSGFGIGTTNSGDMFQIDTNGAIHTPLQPLAEAYYSANTQDGAYAATNRNYVVCKPGATHVNVGNMYNSSTGRFTVTNPGRYLAFVAGSQYSSNVAGYWYVYIRKNNFIQKYIYNSLTGATWETLAGFTTFDMANGDFIDFYNHHDSSTNADRGGWDINNYTKFLVYKLL